MTVRLPFKVLFLSAIPREKPNYVLFRRRPACYTFFMEQHTIRQNLPQNTDTLHGNPPLQGAEQSGFIEIDGNPLHYTAKADWIILQKDDEAKAEMFYISYTATPQEKAGNENSSPKKRPITFVFNGGPGASSVYLHLGALGPDIISCLDNGQPSPPPYSLQPNQETWLQFTDLVFIDPIGTGFSRMIKEPAKDSAKAEKQERPEDSEYWQVKRDLESLGEFMRRYLNHNHRWESPVYIAGESYGGFRTAKLAKMAQQEFGIPLCGVIIISPALEFTLLDGSDYDVLMWLDAFPSLAAAAFFHRKSRCHTEHDTLTTYRNRAAEFAVTKLLPVLAAGDLYGKEQSETVLEEAAGFIGLPPETVKAKYGRITIEYFVKNLLRIEGRHLGLYDASLTVTDPYPDRETYNGPDPTLHQLERVFSAGINTRIRKEIGLVTDREYALLSEAVNKKWKVDTRNHALETQVGATDDLRYGMSLNPDMKVFLTHGIFDLVTPWFSAERITHLMKLTQEQKQQLILKFYEGGHMFYTWKESRSAFFKDMQSFYTA